MSDSHKADRIPEVQRLLPQNLDSELAMLSSFLLSPDYTAEVCSQKGVTPAHFHVPAHSTIFAVLEETNDAKRPCDFVTLTQELRSRGELEACGGAAFITSLFTYIPTAVNAGYYADFLVESYTLREIIKVCTGIASRAYDPTEQPGALLEELEMKALAIRKTDDAELREVCTKDGVMAALDSIERLYASRGAISGLSTGFADLDRMTDGLHPGEMIVIAARPSMGKTALAMNMAEHIAVTQGKAVAVFSAEMSAVQLHQRLICSRARVNLHRVREGFLMDGSFPAITRAATEIAESQLFIVDAVAATINAVRAKARRLHRKHGLSAIFVDYLQLLHSRSAQSKHNREREISEISQGLKSLGKELDVPIVVLSQLNRNADGRTGSDKGRPMLSDLRESGSIEQDADFVGLLMREEYYVTDEQERLEVEGRATLIIAKQRNGPVGDVRLMFLKEFMRFEDREKKDDARGD